MKAKIKFVKFEKALAMQVLHMDNRFRAGKDAGGKRFTSKKANFTIVSSVTPYMDKQDNEIALWGYRNDLNVKVVIQYFIDNDSRDEFLNDAIKALKDWAESWEGWRDECTATVDDDIDNSIIVEV